MERLKQYKYIILVTLVILSSAFYWFEYRPVQIRKECAKQILISSGVASYAEYLKETNQSEKEYKDCLRERGLIN